MRAGAVSLLGNLEVILSLPDSQEGYQNWFLSVKEAVLRARSRAGLQANANLIHLYWNIGRSILQKQETEGWGAGVIPRLSRDLGKEFGTRGFSPRNLKYMKDFASRWPDPQILQHAAAKLPWGHHQVLLDRLADDAPMSFYVECAVSERWSRTLLIHHVETRLDLSRGKSLTNFRSTMPSDRADIAVDLFKDPYVLNFVGADDYRHERHLQASILLRVKDLLLELGKGFAFYGENYHISTGNKDYYLDLIFYHTKLHNFIVVDLKMDEFKAEYAGKMGLYLSMVDDLIRDKNVDNPSIGLILCRGKDNFDVRYSIDSQNRPMAVSDYKVLPASYASVLPSAEILSRHLGLHTTERVFDHNSAENLDGIKGTNEGTEDDSEENDGLSGGP